MKIRIAGTKPEVEEIVEVGLKPNDCGHGVVLFAYTTVGEAKSADVDLLEIGEDGVLSLFSSAGSFFVRDEEGYPLIDFIDFV